jgi:hypothetical protein
MTIYNESGNTRSKAIIILKILDTKCQNASEIFAKMVLARLFQFISPSSTYEQIIQLSISPYSFDIVMFKIISI